MMAQYIWKHFLTGAILILVGFLAASSAYATSSSPSPNTQVFVAADLTLTSSAVSNFPSETFVVLQASAAPFTAPPGPTTSGTNHLVATLFIFKPVSSCRIGVPTVVAMSGTLFTNSTTGTQTLNFTGYAPPDPCIQLAAGWVNIVIGPAYEPPDPCILTFHFPGITITFTGQTARFIVTTTTTTTTTPPT